MPQQNIPMPSYAFLNGAILPWCEATLHISTHAVLYGTGCYEGIRAYWNEQEEQLYIFRGQDHYKRLKNSCKIILVNLDRSVEDLMAITKELLRRNCFQTDVYIRPVAFKHQHPKLIGLDLMNVSDGFFVIAFPMQQYHSTSVLHVGTSSWRRVKDTGLPARGKINGLYINNALARVEAMMNGYDDALTLTEEGYVSEGSTSNIVIVRGGWLVTSPPYMDILEGITLDTVIQIARHLDMPIDVRPIHRSEVYVADEVFYCGTASEVKAVTQVDNRTVGDGDVGPVTQKIQDAFRHIVAGLKPGFANWLDPVY